MFTPLTFGYCFVQGHSYENKVSKRKREILLWSFWFIHFYNASIKKVKHSFATHTLLSVTDTIFHQYTDTMLFMIRLL